MMNTTAQSSGIVTGALASMTISTDAAVLSIIGILCFVFVAALLFLLRYGRRNS